MVRQKRKSTNDDSGPEVMANGKVEDIPVFFNEFEIRQRRPASSNEEVQG